MTTSDPPGAMPNKDSVADRLDRSRRDLLDLTLRNPLLNFRPSKMRGLAVVDEMPSETFRVLVRDRRPMSFQPASAAPGAPTADVQDVPEDLLSLMAADPDASRPADRHTDNRLQTPYENTQLGRRLRNTYRSAHTSIEEEGVNILYLALGMLRWYESASSSDMRTAPLILVPAALCRTNARTRFTLRFTEDEIAANLSLQAKLSQDFGLRLPDLPDVEDIDVDEYFEKTRAAVRAEDRWSVDDRAIHLGFFSFNKLLIYKDLDPASWPEGERPGDHPVIRALLGEDGFREPDSTITEDDHLDDHLGVSDTHHVVDADSSQTLAIIDVKHGRNLVIQGPPGTGKSQTITNLIAEAVADDRKVLFVAEKMAALDVVKRRLDEIHIGDACLELHSHTANKRAVLDELKRTLALGKPCLDDPTEDRAVLAENRKRLNAYSRAVNTPIGASGVSPHDAIGRLAQLEQAGSAAWPPIEIAAAPSWTRVEFTARRDRVEVLRQVIVDIIGAPVDHHFWPSGRRTLLRMDRAAVARSLTAACEAVAALRAAAEDLRQSLGAESTPDTAQALDMLVGTAVRAAGAPRLAGFDHRSPDWIARADELRSAARAIGEHADLHDAYAPLLRRDAWDADVESWRQPIWTWSRRWWRGVSRKYRTARDGLRMLCRGELPTDGSKQLAIVDAILDARRLRATIERSRELLSRLALEPPLDGDVSAQREFGETVAWLLDLHADRAVGAVADAIHDILDRGLERPAIEDRAARCRSAMDTLTGTVDAVASQLDVQPERVPEGMALAERRFSDLSAWLQHGRDKIETLDDIVHFNQHAARLADEGLGAVAEIASHWKDAGRHLTDLIEHCRLFALIRQAFDEQPVLAEFDGATHQQVIDRFRQLDLDLFQHNRALVADAHWERLPRGEGGGQLGVVRREFEKKRRHLPLRRLMTEGGNAILQIKPIIMMSPLSIAKFVPPDSVRFDLVIFDEASQVRPVDAMGALLRASQAVVVGDSRQLPPTSFFERIEDDDGDDDDEATTSTRDIESILGMFRAAGAPERMLRRHYRSRHESLIAISNHEFYDDRLVLFPGPDAGREETGLRFRLHADTRYERGARINAGEAGVVADAVMAHARKSPRLTLGVATFSLSQARRIEDEVEIRRRRDPSTEPFFADHPEEPFFVKNLENVQGDERDVMLISVGYGRIASGSMRKNFGPLNREGGERRLNVLITRARRRCEVHANFTADDLDLSRSGARGVEALKTFLQYADTGVLDVPRATGRDADSPFETAVADALRGRGHRVEHQIGSAGFFIDLAVVDPRRPGRYLLGIECDGATYHSARSARDRDRLRQQILEGLGWTIHRIWSTDWFQDHRREIEKVDGAIRRAGAGAPPAPARDALSSRPVQRDEPVVRPVDDASCRYELARITIEHGDGESQSLLHIVDVESPIHVEEATRRMAAQNQRATKKRIRAIAALAERLAATGAIQRRGDFLWRAGHDSPDVRRRDDDLPSSLSKPDMLAPEEVAAALLHVVRHSYGIDADSAVIRATRLFGFRRAGSELRSRFSTVLNDLVHENVLQEHGGQFKVRANGD